MKTHEWLDRLTGGLRGRDKAALGRMAMDPVVAPVCGTGETPAPYAAALAAQGGLGGLDGLGGETLADALDAMRALAMTAEAANAELDAMEAGWLPDADGAAEIDALDRVVKAESALMLHVRAFDAGLALLAEVERGRRRVDASLKGLRAGATEADGKAD